MLLDLIETGSEAVVFRGRGGKFLELDHRLGSNIPIRLLPLAQDVSDFYDFGQYRCTIHLHGLRWVSGQSKGKDPLAQDGTYVECAPLLYLVDVESLVIATSDTTLPLSLAPFSNTLFGAKEKGERKAEEMGGKGQENNQFLIVLMQLRRATLRVGPAVATAPRSGQQRWWCQARHSGEGSSISPAAWPPQQQGGSSLVLSSSSSRLIRPFFLTWAHRRTSSAATNSSAASPLSTASNTSRI